MRGRNRIIFGDFKELRLVTLARHILDKSFQPRGFTRRIPNDFTNQIHPLIATCIGYGAACHIELVSGVWRIFQCQFKLRPVLFMNSGKNAMGFDFLRYI